MLKKIVIYFTLIIVCGLPLILAAPTINNNIGNPNMITYLNFDEGGLMDEAWYYYSGEKRDSFQWDCDYGLEMLYLAGIARVALSRFIVFTPGTFVLILRWIHLIAWILAIVALWRLVGRHFAKGWQQALTVLLAGVTPVFSYLCNNLKPDPLALFFTILGLDYCLRIIEGPSRKRYLVMALAFASLAFLVKYAGLFLLPAIIVSMSLADRLRKNTGEGTAVFGGIRPSWLFPSLIGLLVAILPLAIMVFYVRRSTGSTWHAEYGFLRTLMENRQVLFVYIASASLIIASPVIYLLNKSAKPMLKKAMTWVNTFNSNALVACGLFAAFTMVFGFGWITNPKHFIQTYAQFGLLVTNSKAIMTVAEKGLASSFLANLTDMIMAFGPIMLLLFAFYLVMEFSRLRRDLKSVSPEPFKRLVLLSFLVLPLILMCSMLNISRHHMLPFFAAMSILIVQGLRMFMEGFGGRRALKAGVAGTVMALLAVEIMINGAGMVKERLYAFRQHEDVAYEIDRWWKDNIPADAKVVSDHYTYVYIPSGYKNVKVLDWNETDKAARFRRIVDSYRPEFIYYDEYPYRKEARRRVPISEILPGRPVELVRSFEESARPYRRWKGSRFMIYRIFY